MAPNTASRASTLFTSLGDDLFNARNRKEKLVGAPILDFLAARAMAAFFAAALRLLGGIELI